MVYKKYIKRGGKTFGPYYYESYRENGKVKTRFVSGPGDEDNRLFKKVLGVIGFLLIVAVLIYSFGSIGFAGNVVNDQNKIEIINAELYDLNGNFVSNFYDLVSVQDDEWLRVNNGETLRVTFEQELDSGNDVSFYARSLDEYAFVEIYPSGSSDLLSRIDVSLEDNYKVHLSNLVGNSKSFDLKAVGDLEFDYIYDPLVSEAFNITVTDSTSDAIAYGISVDGVGNISIAGTFDASSDPISYVAKYNSTGGHIWNDTFQWGDTDNGAWNNAIDLDSEGNVYVAGQGGSADGVLYILKYNSSGSQLWNSTYNVTSNEEIGTGVSVDSAGDNIYVSGYAATYANYTLLKYTSSGSLVFVVNFSSGLGTGHDNDQAHDVDVDVNGDIYITGQANISGKYDHYTIKYNSSGSELFNVTGPVGTAYGVATDVDANFYVTGESNNDFFTAKYNSSGSEIWNVTTMGGGNDVARDVVIDNESNVYVTGDRNNGGDTDFFTIKYDSSGNQVWNFSRDVSSDGADVSRGIDLDSNNSAYVAGQGAINGGASIFVFKYTQDLAPISTLSSPPNNNQSDLGIITFECNATDETNLANVTLYVYNSSHELITTNTTNWTGTSNSTTFNYNFTYYNSTLWNCLVFDNASQSDWDVNRSLNITDLTFPTVNITSPINASSSTDTTLDVLYTVSDNSAVDTCWYTTDKGVTNTTLASCANITSVTWSVLTHNVTVYANDTSNNVGSDSITFTITEETTTTTPSGGGGGSSPDRGSAAPTTGKVVDPIKELVVEEESCNLDLICSNIDNSGLTTNSMICAKESRCVCCAFIGEEFNQCTEWSECKLDYGIRTFNLLSTPLTVLDKQAFYDAEDEEEEVALSRGFVAEQFQIKGFQERICGGVAERRSCNPEVKNVTVVKRPVPKEDPTKGEESVIEVSSSSGGGGRSFISFFKDESGITGMNIALLFEENDNESLLEEEIIKKVIVDENYDFYLILFIIFIIGTGIYLRYKFKN